MLGNWENFILPSIECSNVSLNLPNIQNGPNTYSSFIEHVKSEYRLNKEFWIRPNINEYLQIGKKLRLNYS
jgi:hypothetical protein